VFDEPVIASLCNLLLLTAKEAETKKFSGNCAKMIICNIVISTDGTFKGTKWFVAMSGR
jgi:hypothetical protein